MRQQYFVLVLAHSLHGRLRRIQIPHKYLYAAVALFFFGSVAMFGMISSYVRMTVKISNYNNLRAEVDTLRARVRALKAETSEKDHQLASLQLLAREVRMAYGFARSLEGNSDISAGGRLVPTVKESMEEYNFLRSASISQIQRQYARQWLTHDQPALWPVQGRLMSYFGLRTDPFSGEGATHTGIDLAANTGTPVQATADGIVAKAEWSGRYGKLVVVDHGHGLQTWYAHLSRMNVVPGQEIRIGQVLGLSGGTGRVTAPHLHYEVRVGGNPVNPKRFMTSAAAPADAPVRHTELSF